MMTVPTLKDIAKRNPKMLSFTDDINESDYLEDDEPYSDIIYPMPEWMDDLFEEFTMRQ